MTNSNGSPTLRHRVFEGNRALGAGGGMYCSVGFPFLIDSTFVGNGVVSG